MSKLTLSLLICISILVGIGITNTFASVGYNFYDLHINQTEISIFDKKFSDWNFSSYYGVDLSRIYVTPLSDDPLNPGLQFTIGPEYSMIPDFTLYYDVATIDGVARIKDASLEITDINITDIDNAAFRIDEYEYDSALFFYTVEVINLDADPDIFEPFASSNFIPQSNMTVATIVSDYGAFDFSTDSITFEQRFSQIPEPSTILLLGFGLAGVGLLKRKFKK
jgi:hypothetical protein